ncbi:putative guanylate-binding protein [Toxoplasma gondii CAST]|uniref:Putative guanylate-binding protein n=1 Tax=Toxoplasma gondii CAST TaxID=943122 RepID=A0A3R7YT30_TOXGO|nr:putative guanylate-binding protein [Toxoplasma gondii CAST]
MHPPVSARPVSRAPELFASALGPAQRVESSSLCRSLSQRAPGASPLTLSAAGVAPPMSPACFAAGDLASTSLSGVEPKAQKPIRSGSKNFSDPSRRLRNPLEKTEAPWGVSLTPPAREADATTLEARANLQNQAAKPDTLSSDEDLNLVATAPSSRKVSTHRTGLDMARNGYRTVDPWASYDARQDENGAKSAIFSGLAASAAAQNEPQKTWGAKGQAANPAQAVTRLVGEKDTGESEYPYTAKGSNDSCSTATSNYHEAARSGGPTWGRLALSDGIRYASAYLGKSFSGTGRDAVRGDSQALYASATSVGDVFFRPTVSANGAAPGAVPAQPYTSYIFDPMTHNGTSAYSKIYSQTDQTGLLRSAEDGNAASPLGTTRPGAPVYPVTLGYTAATSGYGQAVGSTQGLPAFPVAPLEPMYLSCNSVDYRPAVKLSPVRNVTSGVSPAAPAPVSWHALSSLLASAPSPPVCPPVSGAPGVPPPSQPTRDTPPAAVHSTEASASPPPSPAERQQDDLDKKVRRNLRTVSDGLGDSSCRALSPAGSPSTQSRLHLFCGVVARPMKPAGGLGASPRDRGAHHASLQASFQTGERNAVGLTSLLLEKTAKPANRTRLLSKPLQLVHVNRWDGREVLTIDEQAKKFLSELGTQHVAVISICGVTQTGKSSFANLLLDDSHMLSAGGFPVGSPALCGDRGAFRSVSPCNSFAVGDRRAPEGLGAETGDDEDEFRGEAGKKFTQRILSDGCTEGVWIQAVCGGSSEAGADGREDLVYLILDFEGVGCTRKTVEHDQRLFTLAMLVSHYLIYTTRGVLDADAVSGLASVSLWTQRLLQGGGDRGPAREASPLDTSRASPTREGASPTAGPSVPSGWRAPPLLWILQDFNFTLCDEDGYPLTETDYLEGIMATASHPASCCSPFSTFPASSTALSRTCAELNLPHVRMLRQQLETLFGDRTCVGLPHPLGDFGPDFGDSVGCEVPSQGSKSAREGASVGAFLATPRQSAAFASSFPCLGNRARTAEGVGESRSPGTRQGDAQSAFSASSPPPTQGRSRGRDGPALETVPVSEFQPIFRRRMQQTKNLVFKECRLKVAQSVAITGPGFVKILQRMIDGINGGQVPESGSVVVVVQREECRKWKEKCEEVFVNDLREAFQSRLPLASRELQEGALALQKKALALFKMHVIGDDDVVRGYKQQLKDRLRKITDRAMDENERHGEWKARSRLRALRERLRIDEKLNERLYESMTEVNEDAERLKREFNADIRGPSHVYQRVINDQIDELLAKGSEIVCGALLDQSRLAEKTVHELQQRAQDAEMSLEKALELEQQLQHRDYEAEELRRALQEERAANRGQATLRSGEFDCDEDFDDPYRRRGSFYRRSGRSRFATGDQSKCFRQRKCTIM